MYTDHTGTSLYCLALVARGACIPQSHEVVTIRETILGRLLPSPEHCTDNRFKHTSTLLVKKKKKKKLYLLVLKLQSEDSLQVCHTSKGHRDAVRGCRPGNIILVLSLALPQLAGTS